MGIKDGGSLVVCDFVIIFAGNKKEAMTKDIYLAGGCFWGTEHYFKQIEGVVDTEVGFANGHTAHPTYQEVYTDDDGREIRTWYTYMDGNCARVGQCCVHHYPNGKGYNMKNGARVIAWQPMPKFPDEYPHREFRKGARCPGDDD